MGKLILEDMEFYAYHGCFKEEQQIGGRFIVNMEISLNTEEAESNDNLSGTINYQDVYDMIGTQMQIKSKLLENVGRRILDAIIEKFDFIEHAKIKISKLNPPIGGKVKAFTVTLEKFSEKNNFVK